MTESTVTVAGLVGAMIEVVLPTLLMASTGPFTDRLALACTVEASVEVTVTVFVFAPDVPAMASKKKICDPPPVHGLPVQPLSEETFQTTEPVPPFAGREVGDGDALLP